MKTHELKPKIDGTAFFSCHGVITFFGFNVLNKNIMALLLLLPLCQTVLVYFSGPVFLKYLEIVRMIRKVKENDKSKSHSITISKKINQNTFLPPQNLLSHQKSISAYFSRNLDMKYTLGEPNPDSLSTMRVRIGLSQSVVCYCISFTTNMTGILKKTFQNTFFQQKIRSNLKILLERLVTF